MARLDLVLGTPQQAQSALTEDMFGANYVYDYERIGDLPWARFDELIDQLGLFAVHNYSREFIDMWTSNQHVKCGDKQPSWFHVATS